MRFLVIMALGLLTSTSLAATKPKAKPVAEPVTAQPSDEASEFFIDRGMVEKVYDTTVETQRRASQVNGDTRMEASIGTLAADTMVVSNDYFEVDHAANGDGLPYLSISAARKLVTRGRNDFYLEGAAGFGTRQIEYNVHSKVGIDVEDLVTLQWLPVATGLRVEHRPTFTTLVKPSFVTGVGATWLNQRGTLEGMNQSYWLPTWQAGPALTLFGGGDHDESAFGGIVATALYRSSANASAKIVGWSYSVGSRILL